MTLDFITIIADTTHLNPINTVSHTPLVPVSITHPSPAMICSTRVFRTLKWQEYYMHLVHSIHAIHGSTSFYSSSFTSSSIKHLLFNMNTCHDFPSNYVGSLANVLTTKKPSSYP